MTASRKFAEAISEGINWLTWLGRQPEGDEVVREQANAIKALAGMATAMDAVLRGEVWSSAPIQAELVRDLDQVQEELRAGYVSDKALSAAKRILRAFSSSKLGGQVT